MCVLKKRKKKKKRERERDGPIRYFKTMHYITGKLVSFPRYWNNSSNLIHLLLKVIDDIKFKKMVPSQCYVHRIIIFVGETLLNINK